MTPMPAGTTPQANSEIHILIVDDDLEIRQLLARYLSEQGFQVTTAESGSKMNRALAKRTHDLVVLDVMLQDASGLDLCRTLRAQSATPIILLTALKEDIDRIIGLELGADDYVSKPFNPRELLARIRAVLRRSSGQPAQPAPLAYSFEGFQAEVDSRRVLDPKGVEIPLTAAEFDLLLAFLQRPGRVLSRDYLLDLTHGKEAASFDRSIDVLVSRLRRKLGDTGRFSLLKTLRNGGYQFAGRIEPRRGGSPASRTVN
ncbi:MAG TPA: response regulator transcription factor [Reyranella sp.]|nr:response regulator transcription factor [Reyranella sp.]